MKVQNLKAYKIIVKGRVQRVGFRYYILDLAQELNLSGYIANLPDGSVEIFIQGPNEKLNEFKSKISEAPAPAKIKDIIIHEAKFNSKYKHFQTKYGSLEEELQEGFGTIHSILLIYWNKSRKSAKKTRGEP